MNFAFIMSEEVGLRTQYLNWKNNFPTDLGIEPHWIVISFHQPGGWIERLPGIPNFVKTRIRAALEIREGLRKEPFDATFVAVHSALATLPSYTARNACFTTLDVTPKQLHDFGDFYGKYPSRIAAVEQYKHRARARNYQSYRGLFPWSHWAANSLRTDYGVESDKIHVIPPGVDTNSWRPPDNPLPSNNTNLLFVGGDFERKGGPLLLDWAQMTTQQNWHLNIVTREHVETSDPRITVHTGLSSNDPVLKCLYQNSDLFVLPTLADCYSIAGIEALASGLPLVISLTGGTGDVVRDGVTGFLMRAPSVAELDTKLALLVTDAQFRKSMAIAARTDAEERYNVSTNIRKTLDIMLKSL
jgi:glycosyltransferase involved in cell wall biosynthesis